MTTKDNASRISQLIQEHEAEIGSQWIAQLEALLVRGTASSKEQLRNHCQQFLAAFAVATRAGELENIEHRSWDEVRDLLSEISSSRAKTGSTPAETASFVFSLKQPLFAQLTAGFADDAAALAGASWSVSSLLDKLGLYTIEVFQKAKDQIIVRQQQELLELSTPVVKLWNGILALPLIGTLDSARTQVVMENILQKIVDTGAEIAIIDITGVPMVDTLVAQHLMKTIAAARLMGADCIISGIRPQIAQTIVHLGVNLEDVVTKATLADAFLVALERTGASVTIGKKN
ncbi:MULTISPECIES: STAS domain-containing protein [unclassified Massilia]|uniref:STAS domain-containing protein n=1 Tax=unclassified Massilia TaxID=2609279 RepID=UPI001786BFD3|nr:MULTISPECIES: STAS domain-containing protein [unclassified Massilia]MBD8532513.1 STAS domain-containing protein [Massilia sp. CFBP 13647]MBD8675884.1 STAS domain-containing protein [Massilia sp. CFBP 13721]